MTDEKPLHVRVAERIKAKVLVTECGCWEWQGYRDRAGYGRFSVGNRPTIVARAVYVAFVGPIPPGLTIDHYRMNPGPRQAPCSKACVNPDHLEPATQGENTLRANTTSGRNARASQCPQAHPYDVANTYRDRRGRRQCRVCRAERPITAAEKEAARLRALRNRRALGIGPKIVNPTPRHLRPARQAYMKQYGKEYRQRER